VTHLPQIAALADQHLVVTKRPERGRTVAQVSCLSPAERIEEIARMLGGETITPAARDHAREMLKQSLQA
jgi:DNA repair protein RecN (Recombination protein N)